MSEEHRGEGMDALQVLREVCSISGRQWEQARCCPMHHATTP
jgi:hypothetical protein